MSDLDDLIEQHLAEFSRPGVLSVRPGHEFTGGWLTGRPAIVVTVAKKHQVGSDQALPEQIAGVPVDVRQASAAKKAALQAHSFQTSDLAVSPDTGALPEFPTERVVTADGTFSTLSPSPQPAVTKPQLAYQGPAGAALTPVTGQYTLRLSASPDSGWPVLADFLSGTTSSLTVGLYDFTSAHVLAGFETAMAGKSVRLVLDHPARNPTADQTDDETLAALRTALSDGLTQAWALERSDPHAAVWIFPSAYHIKTAVRDSSAVWLSSGNWNNSNQPDIDPVRNSGDATAARSGDRDWHVVIENVDLAKTFEAYLTNDLTVAAAHQATGSPTAGEPAAPAPQLQTPPFDQFFADRTVSGAMTIAPVLTPDGPDQYSAAVTALIATATTSLHMQFQYIDLPKTSTPPPGFAALIAAVAARQQAGVDVKIILSEYETEGYLELLQEGGLDVKDAVRIQNNVHNKGIVVDRSAVLVSSQNWSGAGTTANRDAGVIVDNADAAAYFDQIFQHDWDHLATAQAAQD